MRHRKKAIGAGVLAVAGGIVALAIQVDTYLMEREQKREQMVFDRAVRECEASGGHWFQGACHEPHDGPEEP